MSDKPRIGLTMRLELDTRRFYLGRDYSEALEAQGAVPVHIALIPKKDFIAECVKGLDGILLPGSDSDVDPAYFGEDPHPNLKRVVPEKDETDLLVLEEAERLSIPVLGICYGMQSLNVSRGGTLIQDIESQVEKAIKHEQGMPLARTSHVIEIDSEGFVSALAGKGIDSVKVNSHHHQAIDKVGKNLKTVARSRDGIIEAVEDTRPDRFVRAVQWHPELSWETDELSKKIFAEFVSACAAHGEKFERTTSSAL